MKRFQTKYGIEQTGFVGPQMRSKLNSLILSQESQLYHCPSASSTNCTPPPRGFSKPQKPSLSANNSELSITPSKNPPHIISVLPSYGLVGTLITINGTGFTQSGNDIHFDDGGTRNVNAGVSGTALTFIIPGSVGGCYWGSTSTTCNEPIKPIIPGGSYPVSVKNTYGISNSIFFNISSLTTPVNSDISNVPPPPSPLAPPPPPLPPAPVSNIPSCVPGKTDYFSVLPLALDDIENAVPLGGLHPTGHVFPSDHIGFYIRQYENKTDDPLLYAPGDIWITRIREQNNITDNYVDYALYFSSCSDVLHVFGHVRNLSQKLKDAFVPPFDNNSDFSYPTGGKYYSNRYKTVEIHIKAGEVFGTALRRGSLDFTTIDRRIPDLVFANPSRWGSDTKRTVCSIDYFTSGLKNDLRNLFSYNRFRLKRTVEPVCGQFAEDVPGTAQGAWFLKGTATKNYIQDLQLALVHDNLDPTYGVFSVGNGLSEIGVKSEIHNFKPLHSGEYNRDFNEVTPDGKVYCYNAIFGYSEIYGFLSPNPDIKPLLLQLASPTTLRVANLSNATSTCGYGPWTIGDKFVDYER